MMRLFRRRPAPVPVMTLGAAIVLDELAEAYWADPNTVADLLIQHGSARLALDALVISPHAADHEIAMAAAEADGTRGALLTYCTTTEETR